MEKILDIFTLLKCSLICSYITFVKLILGLPPVMYQEVVKVFCIGLCMVESISRIQKW